MAKSLIVTGTTYWQQQVWSHPICYFITHENHSPQLVELINNQWYGLFVLNSHWATWSSLLISTPDVVGLGQYQPPSSTQIIIRPQSHSSFCAPSAASSSSSSSTASAHTASSIGSNAPTSPAVQALPPSIHMLIVASNLALPSTAPTMSVNATTTAPTPTNGLKGIAPAIFTGDQSCADNFLNKFWRYKLLNRNNDSMSVPFYRVLTMLS